MSENLAPEQIQSLTFGYSDSEDRLWVRTILPASSEAVFWLNRRFTVSLLNGLIDVLKNTYANNGLSFLLKESFLKIKEPPTSNSPTPPPPGNLSKKIFQHGLCHSIDITPGTDWVLIWKISPTINYKLTCNQSTYLELIRAIHTQTENAQWNIALDI